MELGSITEWGILSVLLGVRNKVVQRIKKDNAGDSLTAAQVIIKAWLVDTDKPSWAMLVTALKDDLVGKVAIGNEVAEKHPIASE